MAFEISHKKRAARPAGPTRRPFTSTPLVIAGRQTPAEAGADAFAAKALTQPRGGARGHGLSLNAEAVGPVQKADPALASTVAHARAHGGEALPTGARGQLERSSGRSLADVEVHHGRYADQLVRGLGTRAFSVGDDLFFRSDAYRPDRQAGLSLLAHEVAHTMQRAEVQGAQIVRMAPPASADRIAVDPEPPPEREALPEVTRAWLELMFGGSLGITGQDLEVTAGDPMREAYNGASGNASIAMTTGNFANVSGSITHDAQTSTSIDRDGAADRLTTTATGTRQQGNVSVTGKLLAHEQIHKDFAVFAVIHANYLIHTLTEDPNQQGALTTDQMQEVMQGAHDFKERWSRFYDQDSGVIDGPGKGTGHDSNSSNQLTYWNTGEWYYAATRDWQDNAIPDITRAVVSKRMISFGGIP